MLMLILGMMFIYLIWTLMGGPSKKKPEQRRFSPQTQEERNR